MEEMIREIEPKNMKSIRIDVEEFVELYAQGGVEFVDVRTSMETKVWQLNFGHQIPASTLPDRLDELDKSKLIVVACPNEARSNPSRMYLSSQGFDTRYLVGGILALTKRLAGGKAKDLRV